MMFHSIDLGRLRHGPDGLDAPVIPNIHRVDDLAGYILGFRNGSAGAGTVELSAFSFGGRHNYESSKHQ